MESNLPLEPDVNKPVDVSTVSRRLRDANVSLESIAIPLRKGTKVPRGKWKDESNRQSLSDAPQNYAVFPEGDLTFVDIDNRENAPETLLKNTQGTFTVESPHGEHRWIRVPDDIPNIKREWGELRTDNQYVVGPGSSLTDCDEGCCTPENPGIYEKKNDREILRVSKKDLEEWIGGFEKETEPTETTPSPNGEPLPEPDRNDIKIAKHALSELQSDCTPLFKCLMDRLNGGRGDMEDELTKDGEIDTSRQDFVTIEHLYGVFKHYGNEDPRAKELARAKYSEHVRENPFTKDGQSRKWKDRGRKYRSDMVKHAARAFDKSDFQRMLNKTSSTTIPGRYGSIVRGVSLFSIDLLTGELDYPPEEIHEFFLPQYGFAMSLGETEAVVAAAKEHHPLYHCAPGPSSTEDTGVECEYPRKTDVLDFCMTLEEVYKGYPHDRGSFYDCLKNLQNEGRIKVACMKEGVDYRVYSFDCPDPNDAEWVRVNGEEYEPQNEPKGERAIA